MSNPEIAETAATAATAETAVAASEAPRRRRWALLAAVAAGSMLLGAAAATGALLLTGLPGQPVHGYAVIVFLENDVTAQQKAEIQAALAAFNPSGDIAFETREEAWRNFQQMAKDYPDLLQGAEAEDLPESFRLRTEGRLFDCAGYAKVRHMPGVAKVSVFQDRVNGYGATIVCDAEYARP